MKALGLKFTIATLLFSVSPKLFGIPELPSSDSSELLLEATKPFPLKVENRQKVRALLKNPDGTIFNYYGRVLWKSLTPEIAAVSPDAWVTGLREGTAKIQGNFIDLDTKTVIEIPVKADNLEIYFQAPKNWSTANIWYWYLGGNAHASSKDKDGNPLPVMKPKGLGSWPGPEMAAIDGMPGWFSARLPRYDDKNELPGQNLAKQGIRIVFSNPELGEQTRDMLHYDGCFLSYNKFLGAPENKVIDGRWDSPNNCPAFKRNFEVTAEAPGGPIYGGQALVDLNVIGAEASSSSFTLDGKAAKKDDTPFPKGEALVLGEELDNSETLVLCLQGTQGDLKAANRCYQYWKGDASQFKKLGADYTPQHTTFSIWSPDRNYVELWLDGQTLPMGYIGNAIGMPGVWAITIPGNHKLKSYNFILDGATVRDPYGIMVKAGTDYNIVMDLKAIQPEGGWAPAPVVKKREDAIIYEMSIRDFTISANSGLSPDKRGTYLGAVESGTYLNKGQTGADKTITTGIDHLKEMGITHVQLLPVFDSATCSIKDPDNSPNCYNWGYDPENFNVPEERFSARPDDYEFRVKEFKTMVNEFHKAGISVIMDVVYNHTWVRPWRESDEGEKVFGDITGKYFLQDKEGFGYQLTGTGNTIDPSRDPMVDRFIRDSLEFWVENYQIDGFRFDMAGVFEHQKITSWMSYLEKKFPEKKLINFGEPWTALQDPNDQHFRLSNINQMYDEDGRFSHFGGFNFGFREAIKGSNDWGGGGGFAFNDSYNSTTVINGLKGSVGQGDINQSYFADDPVQTINYASVHDNLTLFDKIEAWSQLQDYQVSFDYKARISAFANSIVLMSQGLPMLHSGSELLRSKFGIHDSYNAPDSVNQIDWQRKKDHWQVYDYYRHLVQSRKRFEGLRLASADEINRSMNVTYKGGGLIEAYISKNGNDREELFLILNSGSDREFQLPPGEWTLAIENSVSTRDRKVSGTIKIAGTAITLLFKN